MLKFYTNRRPLSTLGAFRVEVPANEAGPGSQADTQEGPATNGFPIALFACQLAREWASMRNRLRPARHSRITGTRLLLHVLYLAPVPAGYEESRPPALGRPLPRAYSPARHSTLRSHDRTGGLATLR